MREHDPLSRMVTLVRTAEHRPDGRTNREKHRRATMAETYTGEAYCVKCKEKRHFTGEVKVSESGRRMAQGTCPTCGTKVNRILGKA
jgi:hypothetical protein